VRLRIEDFAVAHGIAEQLRRIANQRPNPFGGLPVLFNCFIEIDSIFNPEGPRARR